MRAAEVDVWDLLRQLTAELASVLGDRWEVVLHDFENPESSIVAIANGHISGRKVGGPTSNLGLPMFRTPALARSLFHYRTKTKRNSPMNSSTLCLRDKKGRPFAALCFNWDMEPIAIAAKTLLDMVQIETPDVDEVLGPDIHAVLQHSVDEIVATFNKPIASLTRDERQQIVQALDERGVFMIKGGGEPRGGKPRHLPGHRLQLPLGRPRRPGPARPLTGEARRLFRWALARPLEDLSSRTRSFFPSETTAGRRKAATRPRGRWRVKSAVGIVGAGPAGLTLAHLLARRGIEATVVEARSRKDVERTVRAGVLEQGTMDLLRATGVGARMDRTAAFHDGIEIRFGGRAHRVDMRRLTGRQIALYPQHELLKDLIARNLEAGVQVLFDTPVRELRGVHGARPEILLEDGRILESAFVVGADGSHGPSRKAVPEAARRDFHHTLPFGWLGILARAPRSAPELVYNRSEAGFALVSTRSARVQRMYVQVDVGDSLDLWPDARIWEALHRRVDIPTRPPLIEGEIFQRDIVAMRSFVGETMRWGRLFLMGDAAHIVPATGAKGLNLAVHDATVLARGFAEHFGSGDDGLLERYERICVGRAWRTQRFSMFMTGMLHQYPQHTPFERRIQEADLAHLVSSEAAMRALAANYAGFPLMPEEGEVVGL